MAKRKLSDVETVKSMSGMDSVLGVIGGKLSQILVGNFQRHLNENDTQVLNELAFYIDVNEASPNGATYVNVGGNMNMRQLWEDSKISCLMDANGDYCHLNQNDCRYTEDGEYILTKDGKLAPGWDHLDMMEVIPMTYGRVQVVPVGNRNIERLWLSLVPLPGGFGIPMMPVGKFKVSMIGGIARSVPGYEVEGTHDIYGFWTLAQKRSKSHGLANLNFRNFLLFHMMSKYGQRDSQNCKGSDGSPIWGVGLDGTESKSSDTYASQRYIKTGATLSLGNADGKVPVQDKEGNTVHCISVGGFQDVWGQAWEMTQGLCSIGSVVYCWDGNFMPKTSPAPSDATFEHIKHVRLTRPTTAVWGMNIVSQKDGQGVYMIPMKSVGGISYGDNYWYAAEGQLWLFGGNSNSGADCGLASAYSFSAWSLSLSYSSARLAFYGSIRRKSPREMKKAA